MLKVGLLLNDPLLRCSSMTGTACPGRTGTPFGGRGKLISGAGHIEGPSLLTRSPDADFSDIAGDASTILPGDTATPMSTGFMLFLQKLLLFSSGAAAA